MRILILVQSIDLPNKPDYTRLRKAQEATWDSIPHPNVDVLYYMPGIKPDGIDGNILNITCDTHWTSMFFNLAKAMRYMLKHDMNWDYIFKTDNSTYIDKEMLYEILLTKPREKYYGGMYFPFMIPGVHRMKFFWGDGYALSRDMVAHIVDQYNKAPMKGKQEDDIVVAQLVLDVAEWDPTINIYIPALYKMVVEPGHAVYRCRIDHCNSPAGTTYAHLAEIINNDITMMNKVYACLAESKKTHEDISSSPVH